MKFIFTSEIEVHDTIMIKLRIKRAPLSFVPKVAYRRAIRGLRAKVSGFFYVHRGLISER